MDPINWYPGHMKKTRELIQDNLKLVDAVIEVVDARIPASGRNPVLSEIISSRPEIIVLSKCDLADPSVTRAWQEHFRREGHSAVPVDCRTGKGIHNLFAVLTDMSAAGHRSGNTETEFSGSTESGRGSGAVNTSHNSIPQKSARPLRLMVAGVPNSGKSSLINRMTGRKSAKTGNVPGVTRGKQWLSLENGMQILDTPGILQPKIKDENTGLFLAFTGSIRDEITDRESLALELIRVLCRDYAGLIAERYGVETDSAAETDEALHVMEEICLKRGFILPGKRMDYARCAGTVIDEFREGKTGRITLERPPVREI